MRVQVLNQSNNISIRHSTSKASEWLIFTYRMCAPAGISWHATFIYLFHRTTINSRIYNHHDLARWWQVYDAEGHKNGETKGREKVRMGKALCVPTGSQCAWQSKFRRLRTLLIIALVLLKSETCRKTGIYFTYDACGIKIGHFKPWKWLRFHYI